MRSGSWQPLGVVSGDRIEPPSITPLRFLLPGWEKSLGKPISRPESP